MLAAPMAQQVFWHLDLGEEIKAFNYGPAAARSIVYFLIVIAVAWTFRMATERQKAEPRETIA